MQLTFTALSEDTPGQAWQQQFRRCWPAYRQWFLDTRSDDAPDAATSRAALRHHMPELLPTYDALVVLTDHDDLAARLLSCYCPPPYLSGCSQAALARDEGSVLVRNYDLHPDLNEGVIMRSRWLGHDVIATSEFLWGVADGMNESGLAVSLAFGGSRAVGHGFGIVLILRYVLEVCQGVEDAIAVLQRIPCHMAYNITLLDRRGLSATVQIGPEKPPTIIRTATASNHQGIPVDQAVARFNRTVERGRTLDSLVSDPDTSLQQLRDAFMVSPLYNTQYRQSFGTLYTAAYYPDQGRVEYLWPDECWVQSFADFDESTRSVTYDGVGARVALPPSAPRAHGMASPGNQAVGQPVNWQADVHEILKSLDASVPAWLIEEFGAAAREHKMPFGAGR